MVEQMTLTQLVFTKNFDATFTEAEAAGGQVLHRLSPEIAILSLPDSYQLSELKTCSTQPSALSEDEMFIVRSWESTNASQRQNNYSLMAKSIKENIKWDAPQFKKPEHDEPASNGGNALTAAAAGIAQSTGIPTSLYMTDKVAIGVIVVSGQDWKSISGRLKFVSAASDGTVWGVNSNDDIFRRDGNNWTQISGKLKQISVGSSNQIWGVNSNDDIFRRDGNSWTQISGKLKHVSVASDGTVWGVNSNDDIFRRDGNNWTQISGKLKQVSAGSSSQIWGVNSNDDIFRRDGNSWTQISGKLKYVSVGNNGSIWGVNSNDNIYARKGSNWIGISGGLTQISIGIDSRIWGVNNINNIYERKVLATL